jgi:dTDP-4-amino-4,6-dideoxygalactose transaminase
MADNSSGSQTRRVTGSEPVPFIDLSRALAPLHERASEAFVQLLRSGQATFGPELVAFERHFAEFCGIAHCVGVSDGTAALRMALSALGLEPGQSVVTVPNTFVATVEAIAAAGGRPVLVDVNAEDRCMDIAALRVSLDGEVGAVIPVHLYGRMAAMREIVDACSGADVPVLEDAAQAHGAHLDGRRAGAWGQAAAFSFYPTKNLGALGDAGAVVTDREEVAETVRSLRHHGSAADDANVHIRCGGTARLDAIQAALLSLRLERLDEENADRRRAADAYRELLSDLPVTLPPDDRPGEMQVYHLFVIETPERDRVVEALRAAGIGVGIHYPTPVHLQPAWRHLGYAPGDFPVAERLATTCMSLPCFPGITPEEQVRVATALRDAFR